jgi:hypothetical protein
VVKRRWQEVAFDRCRASGPVKRPSAPLHGNNVSNYGNYNSYAQVQVRLSVVIKSNLMSIIDNITILAYKKPRNS